MTNNMTNNSPNNTPSSSDWQDPYVFGRNKLRPHVPLRAFDDPSKALEYYTRLTPLPEAMVAVEDGATAPPSCHAATAAIRSSTRLLDLSAFDAGDASPWRFRLFDKPEDVPEGFGQHGAGVDWDTWAPISVPCSWECAGFGTPIYTNFQYPWPCDPPRVPSNNPTGCYVRHFVLPHDWRVMMGAGARVTLVLEGVDSAAYVWVNGQHVGYTQDSRLPAEFDITSMLQQQSTLWSTQQHQESTLRSTQHQQVLSTHEGEHVLALQVMKWSDGSYLEDQDMWWLAGLHRPVYLRCKPPVQITDMMLRTPLTFDTAAAAAGAGGGGEEGEGEGQGGVQPNAARLELDVSVAAPSDELLEASTVNVLLYPNAHNANIDSPLLSCSAHPKRGHWMAAEATTGLRGGLATVSIDMIKALGHPPLLWSAEHPHTYVAVVTLTTPHTHNTNTHDELTSTMPMPSTTKPTSIPQPPTSTSATSMPTSTSIHVDCVDCDVDCVDCESMLVAFRSTLIHPTSGLLLNNNRPLLLRGVNRHEHDERRGKALDEGGMVLDVCLMKQCNFNAMRCSHYPTHDRWYELCTMLGLYVIDEVNIETHGFDPALTRNAVNPAWAPEWQACMLDRAVRMVERDKNHGCIILWSLGNESGYGPAHLAMAGYIRTRDPTRPLHYEGGGSITPCTDVICPMYARVHQIQALASRQGDMRPVILCEYCHAMGNSTGNFKSYWDAFHTNPKLQGGFIWDWVDQGLCRALDRQTGNSTGGVSTAARLNGCGTCAGGHVYWAYGGDFGDTPHDAQFCINGLVWPDRSLHPACFEIAMVQAPVQFEGPITPPNPDGDVEIIVLIRNMYDFSTTAHLHFTWRITLEGAPLTGAPGSLQPEGWHTLDLPSIPPRAVADVAVPAPWASVRGALVEGQHGWRNGGLCWREVYLELQACMRSNTPCVPQGHVVAASQLHLPPSLLGTPSPRPHPPPPLPTTLHPTPQWRRTDDGGVVVDAGGVVVVVDGATGCVSSVTYQGNVLLASPLVPCLYRAPTDNDRGGSGGSSYAARWRAAGLHVLTCYLEPDSSITVTHGGGGGGGDDGDGITNTNSIINTHSITNTSSSTHTNTHDNVPSVVVCVRFHMQPDERALQEECGGGDGVGVGEVGGAHFMAQHDLAAGVVGDTGDDGDGDNGGDDGDDTPAAAAPPPQPPSAAAPSAAAAAASTSPRAFIKVYATYTIYADGRVVVNMQVDASEALPAALPVALYRSLPRVGLSTTLGWQHGIVTWYGRGPHECYPDRKTAAHVGRYSMGVEGMHVPYIVPGESGGRADVRWLQCTREQDGSGVALAAVGGASWAMASVLPWSIQQLDAAQHDHELWLQGQVNQEKQGVHVVVDAAHMGLGGDDSWSPAVHEEYLVPPGVYPVALALCPVAPGQRNREDHDALTVAQQLWHTAEGVA